MDGTGNGEGSEVTRDKQTPDASLRSLAARTWQKITNNLMEKLVTLILGVVVTAGAAFTSAFESLTSRFQPSNGAVQYEPPRDVAIGEPIPLDAVIIPRYHINGASIRLTPNRFLDLQPKRNEIALGSITTEATLTKLDKEIPRLFAVRKGQGEISIELLSDGKSIMKEPLKRIVEIRPEYLGNWSILIDRAHGEMELRDTDDDLIYGIYRMDDRTQGSLIGRVDDESITMIALKGESPLRWRLKAELKKIGASLVMTNGTVQEQQASSNGWRTVNQKEFHADKRVAQ
jgi:hypothetical protein